MIAIVVEGDERADGLRIGNTLGHAAMIPATGGRSPRRPADHLRPAVVHRCRRTAVALAATDARPTAAFLANATLGSTTERLGPTKRVARPGRGFTEPNTLTNGQPATHR